MKTAEQIKADMINRKIEQVNAAAVKHAAAIIEYRTAAAADTAARADLYAAGGWNVAPAQLVNAERAARCNREQAEKIFNSTAAIVRRREREFHALRKAA